MVIITGQLSIVAGYSRSYAQNLYLRDPRDRMLMVLIVGTIEMDDQNEKIIQRASLTHH